MCKEQLNTCSENEKALRQKACKALFACIFLIKFHEFYILLCSLSQHIFPQTEISIIQDAVYGSCATIFPYCISPRTFLLSNFLSVCDFDFCCKSCIFKLQAANFCDICKKDTWLLDFGAGFWNVKYNWVAKTYLEISRYLNFTQTELILHVIHFSWNRIKEDWIGGAAFAYMLFNYVLAIWRRRPSVLPVNNERLRLNAGWFLTSVHRQRWPLTRCKETQKYAVSRGNALSTCFLYYYCAISGAHPKGENRYNI